MLRWCAHHPKLFLVIIIHFVIIYGQLLAVFEGLNEVSEIPRMILLHVVNKVLSELLLIKLPYLLLRPSIIRVKNTLKVNLVLSEYLFLLPLPLFLLVLSPLFLEHLFLIDWFLVVGVLVVVGGDVIAAAELLIAVEEIEVLGG